MKKFIIAFALILQLSMLGLAQAQGTETAKTEGCLFEDGKTYQLVPGEEKKEVKYCVELEESIAGAKSVAGEKNGIELFSNYIRVIYVYGASIMGILCVLIIVVSGIQISMGGANNELVNQGKERIMQALLSLILLFASALILRTVNPGFFVNEPPSTSQLNPSLQIERLV